MIQVRVTSTRGKLLRDCRLDNSGSALATDLIVRHDASPWSPGCEFTRSEQHTTGNHVRQVSDNLFVKLFIAGVAGSMVLAPRSPPTTLEPCRVAPYLPALRLHPPPMQASGASVTVGSAFDPAVLHYAAAGGLFCLPPPPPPPPSAGHPAHHPLSLAASLAAAAARSKNSSIADLRLKARRHQEALGLDRPA